VTARRLVPILAAVAVAVAVTGCGGPDEGEFRDAANANCRERQRIETANHDKVDTKPGEWIDVYTREAEKQRSVEVPDDLRGDWDRYLKLMDESERLYRRTYEEDISQGDQSKAGGDANKAGYQARQQAKKLGLDVCAKQIY
jgi:hypothetical protein